MCIRDRVPHVAVVPALGAATGRPSAFATPRMAGCALTRTATVGRPLVTMSGDVYKRQVHTWFAFRGSIPVTQSLFIGKLMSEGEPLSLIHI